jgi:hypothetical protein
MMIDPGQEASMAKQINAATTTLPSSHVLMLFVRAEAFLGNTGSLE